MLILLIFTNIYSIPIKHFFVDSLRILKTQFTKSTCLMYVFHGWNGQISSTYFLILLLKMSTNLEVFMFPEIRSQIFAPRL